MKKTIQFILIFAWMPICVYAQQGTVKGLITDSSKDPLIGATVIVKNTTLGITTDVNGNYELKVPEGKQTLSFSYLGYTTQEKNINVVAGNVQELDIMLSEESTILTTTVVSGSRFEKKLGEETISLDVIKPEFIENQNLVTIDKAVERNPGVVIVDRQVNIRGGAGYSYGAGSRVLILLDDMPMLQADAGGANWNTIPLENIGQIEIIKGAASALYGSSAMNGIINVRTAYATNEPVTKISLFGTQYAQPSSKDGYRRDWWNLSAEEFYNETVSPATGKGNLALVNDLSYIDESGNVVSKYEFRDPARIVRPYQTGITVGHRQKFGKFDLVIGGQAVSSQDHRYNGFEHRGRLNVNTRYRISEKINFGINTNAQYGSNGTFFLWNGFNGINKYIPSDFTGTPTTNKHFRLTVDPFFNYQDEKGNKHKILARWYNSNNESTNDQGNFSNFFYGEYQYQKKWDKADLVLTTGGTASFVEARAPLYGTVGGDNLTGRNFAAFVQLDKKFFKKLNISLGARVENNEITGTKSETKPVVRAGLNYQAAEYTFIRASFGQGYRFPSIAEKFISTALGSTAAIVPNPDLKSETGMSAEFGVKQGLKIGQFNAFADVAVFFSRYFNMMEFNPNPDAVIPPFAVAFQSMNVGNTQIIGLETSLQGEGKLFKKFPTTVMLGYTYIIPTYQDWDVAQSNSVTDYNVLKYRFRHLFTGSWDVNFNGFDIGISTRYYSFMENIDPAFTFIIGGLTAYRDSRLKSNWEDLDPKKQHKGDFILDLRAGYTFKKDKNKYKVSAVVNNVTNREYSLRPGLIEAPLSYSLRLDFEF